MKITVYRPAELPEEHEVELPERPNLTQLKAAIEPFLDGQRLERVNVFWEGRYTDMFVGEHSAGVLERNEAATTIYRNNWLTHQAPDDDPESMPAVYGPAVLCDRRVWF